jgi:hypothetical protein
MRLALAFATLIGLAPASFASDGFNVVIPARPGIPVIINGVDASYGVVEGEFGLGKGVNNQPTVYGGRYDPSLGQRPGYGRLEIEPPANRPLPQPAASYHESWSAHSAPLPATSPPEVPAYPPPVIMAPPTGGDFDRRNKRQPTPKRFPN